MNMWQNFIDLPDDSGEWQNSIDLPDDSGETQQPKATIPPVYERLDRRRRVW